MTISEIAEKWESLAETVNWGTQMLIRSYKIQCVEPEYTLVEFSTHCPELEMDVGQIRERIVHIGAAP